MLLSSFDARVTLSILVYKPRPERTGFHTYAKNTQTQLTFLTLLPCLNRSQWAGPYNLMFGIGERTFQGIKYTFCVIMNFSRFLCMVYYTSEMCTVKICKYHAVINIRDTERPILNRIISTL